MSKVTSKLQVTVPKVLAQRYGIQPGDDISFEPAGEVIRVVPTGSVTRTEGLEVDERLRLFDAASARQELRESRRRARQATSRGWTREELYERGIQDAD